MDPLQLTATAAVLAPMTGRNKLREKEAIVAIAKDGSEGGV